MHVFREYWRHLLEAYLQKSSELLFELQVAVVDDSLAIHIIIYITQFQLLIGNV